MTPQTLKRNGRQDDSDQTKCVDRELINLTREAENMSSPLNTKVASQNEVSFHQEASTQSTILIYILK